MQNLCDMFTQSFSNSEKQWVNLNETHHKITFFAGNLFCIYKTRSNN